MKTFNQHLKIELCNMQLWHKNLGEFKLLLIVPAKFSFAPRKKNCMLQRCKQLWNFGKYCRVFLFFFLWMLHCRVCQKNHQQFIWEQIKVVAVVVVYLEALCANMDMLITRLDVCHVFEWKGNLTDSAVWITGETGDINITLHFIIQIPTVLSN